MIFRDEDSVRPELDERTPVIDMEFTDQAGIGPALGYGVDAAHPAGRFPAGAARIPGELLQGMDRGLGGIRCLSILRALLRP